MGRKDCFVVQRKTITFRSEKVDVLVCSRSQIAEVKGVKSSENVIMIMTDIVKEKHFDRPFMPSQETLQSFTFGLR